MQNIYYLKLVIHREIWWDQYSSMLDPFLKILKKYIKPDFGIDFAFEEIRKNNGLSFLHRKIDNADLYFVTNIQDKHISMPINFRVHNKNVWNWNPYNGDITKLFEYSNSETGMKVPIDLQAWESTIIIFEEGDVTPHVNNSNISKIVEVSNNSVKAEANQNGSYFINIVNNINENFITTEISDVPSAFVINGNWSMTLESDHFKKVEKELSYLTSWSNEADTKYFSGTGKYDIAFKLRDEYVSNDIKLELDLGKLGNIGEVEINGKSAGTIWMKGQKSDITYLVKKGNNQLTVYVTNTNINRVSSFKEIVPVPENLVDKYGEAMTTTSLPREFGFEPLPPSGLIGPVTINPIKMVKIHY